MITYWIELNQSGLTGQIHLLDHKTMLTQYKVYRNKL